MTYYTKQGRTACTSDEPYIYTTILVGFKQYPICGGSVTISYHDD